MRSGSIRAPQDFGVGSPLVVCNITMQDLSGRPGLSIIYEHNRLIINWAMVRRKSSVALREQLLRQSWKEQVWGFFVGPHTWSSIAWWWGVSLTTLIWIFESWLTVGINNCLSSRNKEFREKCFLFFPKNLQLYPSEIKKKVCILNAVLLVLE